MRKHASRVAPACCLIAAATLCGCGAVAKAAAREAVERVAVRAEQRLASRAAERTVIEADARAAAAAVTRAELLSSMNETVRPGVNERLKAELNDASSRFVESANEEERRMKLENPREYTEPVNAPSCGERKVSFEPNIGTDATADETTALENAVGAIDSSFTPIHVDGTASGDTTCVWRDVRFDVTLSGTPVVLAYRDTAGQTHSVIVDFRPSLKLKPA
jgi:hypothetical protein